MANFKSGSSMGGEPLVSLGDVLEVKDSQKIHLDPDGVIISNETFYITLTVGYPTPEQSNNVPDSANRTIGYVYGSRSPGSDNASGGLALVNAAIAGRGGETGRGCSTFELLSRGPMDGENGRLVYLYYEGTRYIALEFATGGHIAYNDSVYFTGWSYLKGQTFALHHGQVSDVEPMTDSIARDSRLHRTGLTIDGSLSSSSDRRKKEDLQRIESTALNLEAVGGYTYRRLGEKNRQTGVLAQELEGSLPGLVRENSEGQKTVCYGSLISYLFEVLKQLRDEVAELKAKKEHKNG